MVILLADKFQSSGQQQLEESGCDVRLDPSLSGDALRAEIADIDPHVLVVRSTKVDAAMLDAGSRLSLVIRAGAGYDTIDVAAASDRGVFVANCPGRNSIAVAELAWALILACDRRVPDQVADLREGRWRKKEFAAARGLYGRTLGILGMGGIGREVAVRAVAFGMPVAAWSRSLTPEMASRLGVQFCETPHELAEVADVISIHVAASTDTENMVDESFLARMKDGATLVNTSRGKIVDEDALAAAVRDRGLRAGLDVYRNEPASGDAEFHPAIVDEACVYGTHHVGASTEQAQDAIAAEVVRIIEDYVSGGVVHNCINIAARTLATSLLAVRHRNLPGVLSHVFDVISHADINVEEMENVMYEGGAAACARIQLDDVPTDEQLEEIRDNANILSVAVSAITSGEQ